MIIRIAIIFSLVVFATGVLATSILRTTTPQYAFSQAPRREKVTQPTAKKPIEYYLVYPGILPDHFLWPLKAFRDRVWLFLTTEPVKRAELLLLFADKRLGASRALLEGGKIELAVATATKAEKYLEQSVQQAEVARKEAKNETQRSQVGQFLERLALSTLKHREVLEDLYTKAPDEARPVITEALNYPKRLFDQLKTILREENRPIPASPFEE